LQSSTTTNIPIWVLTLERTPERQRFIEQQLNDLQLSYRIIYGVDGSNLSEAQESKYSPAAAKKTVGRPLVAGEIGCALSHAMIFEMIAEQSEEMVMVLEDDALVGEMFARFLDSVERLPRDWDLINLSTGAEQIGFGEPIFDIYRMCRFGDHAFGNRAILIRKSAAERLLELVYPVRWYADGLTGQPELSGLGTFGIDPPVVGHGYHDSDIWKDGHNLSGVPKLWALKAMLKLGVKDTVRTLMRRVHGLRIR